MRSSLSGRSLIDHALARLHRLGYLRKWLVLGAVIGLVAGFGAVLFVVALRETTDLLLGVLGGYTPPAPIGEGNHPGSAFLRPWAVPLVVGLGGLLSGILVFTLAPEAEGHGTDAAISAVHHNPRGVRARVTLVKLLASALTIGSGGSAGREGPTAQISAGFGSMLARALDLSPADARIAVTVGIGAGIGAIFRAPLGGAVLGAEILYRDDVEVQALVPSFVASIVGFATFGAFEGFIPIFGFLPGGHFDRPVQLVFYAALGLAAGVVGILYAKGFYGLTDLFRRLPGSPILRPAVAGLLVGLIGLAVPAALGTGYGWLAKAMGTGLLTMPLWLVLAVPVAKILATGLTIGSGGSGGIFGPGMVIGGFVGAAAWRLLQPVVPALPSTPAPFVVVGMVACFGSIAHAPLAMMLMVAEMTGNLEIVAPAMVAVGVATLVVGDRTIYRHQLRSRTESPAHRFRLGMPLLAAVPVRDAMRFPPLLLSHRVGVGEARERLRAAGLRGAVVVDERGRFRGTAWLDRLESAPPEAPVTSLADPRAPAVPADATLGAVVEVLASNQLDWVPVLDLRHRVTGVVSTAQVISGYRTALASSLRRISAVSGGATVVEEELGASSPFAGSRVDESTWPRGCVVVTVLRDGQLLLPTQDTVLRPGDLVSMLVPTGVADSLRAQLRGAEGDGASIEGEGPNPAGAESGAGEPGVSRP